MNYTTFIGKEVKWSEITNEVDEKGKIIINEGTAVINELKFVDGQPVFVLEGGKEITPGNISSIINKSSATENPLVTASSFIGKTVQYDDNGEMLQAIIESVTTNNTVIEYILN